MGNWSSHFPQYELSARLPQDRVYIEHCQRDEPPAEYALRLEWSEERERYEWHTQSGGEPIDAGVRTVEFRRLDEQRQHLLKQAHVQQDRTATRQHMQDVFGHDGDEFRKPVVRVDCGPLRAPRQAARKGLRAVSGDEATPFEWNARNTLILAAAAYTGHRIVHLLDGYSAAVAVYVSQGEGGTLRLFVTVVPAEEQKSLFRHEESGGRLLPGLFTSSPTWNVVGRFISLLVLGNVAVERNTAHQPIYVPFASGSAQLPSASYCAAAKYYSFHPCMERNYLALAQTTGGAPATFAHGDYFCMHPHTDPHRGDALLTYGFAYSVLTDSTRVTFYEYARGQAAPQATPYQIAGNIALHMFGFTEHYYLVFANPLKLTHPSWVMFGSAVLRLLNDDFTSNLIIHVVPRPPPLGASAEVRAAWPRVSFSVDTTLQGFVYHTINCFETSDGRALTVDAFVSQLNAARESAQFELNDDYPVYDNHGDPFRFRIGLPPSTDPVHPKTACRYQILSSAIDSTIDFHCINNTRVGRYHRHSWIVGHQRERDAHGTVTSVVSQLFKIDVNDESLDFNPRATVSRMRLHNGWTGHPDSVYMRTPLYVPPTESDAAEDAGHILVWTYELRSAHKAAILLFDAATLNSMVHIPLPDYYVPYTVHGWVHPSQVNLDANAEEEHPLSSVSTYH